MIKFKQLATIERGILSKAYALNLKIILTADLLVAPL